MGTVACFNITERVIIEGDQGAISFVRSGVGLLFQEVC